jgi:hypothetical protein
MATPTHLYPSAVCPKPLTPTHNSTPPPHTNTYTMSISNRKFWRFIWELLVPELEDPIKIGLILPSIKYPKIWSISPGSKHLNHPSHVVFHLLMAEEKCFVWIQRSCTKISGNHGGSEKTKWGFLSKTHHILPIGASPTVRMAFQMAREDSI